MLAALLFSPAAAAVPAVAGPSCPLALHTACGSVSWPATLKRSGSGVGVGVGRPRLIARCAGQVRDDVFGCARCAGEHQQALREASCSNEAISDWCAGVAPPTPDAPVRDSLLAEQFCQVYYDGDGDCPALRAQVVANHSRALPTLQLGNPAHPPMFFLHGWPDSAAVYANQFEHFCAPPHGTYFCVAPTWFDFHPDVPMRRYDLLWQVQVEAFHAVAVRTPLLFLAARLPS